MFKKYPFSQSGFSVLLNQRNSLQLVYCVNKYPPSFLSSFVCGYIVQPENITPGNAEEEEEEEEEETQNTTCLKNKNKNKRQCGKIKLIDECNHAEYNDL